MVGSVFIRFDIYMRVLQAYNILYNIMYDTDCREDQGRARAGVRGFKPLPWIDIYVLACAYM